MYISSINQHSKLTKMKKSNILHFLFLAFFAVGMSFTLTSCGGNGEEKASDDTEQMEEASTEEEASMEEATDSAAEETMEAKDSMEMDSTDHSDHDHGSEHPSGGSEHPSGGK